ncbi:peptidyl-prolyl cis-trans isomerase SurA [Azospirillaceae bacterium]
MMLSRVFVWIAAVIGLSVCFLCSYAEAIERRSRDVVRSGSTVEHIAAVVNDDAISFSDLKARTQLAILASGLSNNPETQKRLEPQVLRSLIDERLQAQEIKRQNITVSQQEIEGVLQHLAQQNRLPRTQLEKFFNDHGVPLATMVEQIRVGLSWSRLVQRQLRPTIQIGEDEIDAALQRVQANSGKPEYLVAEIFLGVDSSEQDDDVRKAADRLVTQIRQGANFALVARQFSQSAGAAGGGDLGWIQQGQLPDDLDVALRQLRPGQISSPVRSANGYHILLVREQRTNSAGGGAAVAQSKVELRQLMLPFVGGKERATQIARAEDVRKTVRDCNAFDQKVNAYGGPQSGPVGTVRVGDLPPDIARVVASLPVGQPSPPLVNDKVVLILAVCGREINQSALPGRDEVANQIGQERLEMLQRRYMRDLRRAAFIEPRARW